MWRQQPGRTETNGPEPYQADDGLPDGHMMLSVLSHSDLVVSELPPI
jgi:hypothetical protein